MLPVDVFLSLAFFSHPARTCLMTDDDRFDGHRSKARQPKPGEIIWTTKGGEEARAELRDQGVAGVELQLSRASDFANGRLSLSREAALEAAAVLRQQMLEWAGTMQRRATRDHTCPESAHTATPLDHLSPIRQTPVPRSVKNCSI